MPASEKAARARQPPAELKHLSVRQAAFIGVGAMVGAGIFALLGAAGDVAGAAVWLSFLIAGAVAVLQGYSFAKLGARYPSAGGLLEYVAKGFGGGHVTGITAWLTYSANAIVTAMVAVSFGSYASAMLAGDNAAWAKAFAVLIIAIMTVVNIVGSQLVARAQTVIVYVVLGILALFAVVTIANMHPSLLAPSGYPPLREIVSSVALTFFAFLGFGIITFTAKDLSEPSHQLPRAMYLALGVATVIYVAVFKLDAIASIGSAVALLIFTLITAAHFRVRAQTHANALLLWLAIVAAGVVLVTFVFTTLIHEPASVVTLLAILALGVALDLGWKRRSVARPGAERT
jgi:amino acid transporter